VPESSQNEKPEKSVLQELREARARVTRLEKARTDAKEQTSIRENDFKMEIVRLKVISGWVQRPTIQSHTIHNFVFLNCRAVCCTYISISLGFKFKM
jgi:hypothetical protein